MVSLLAHYSSAAAGTTIYKEDINLTDSRRWVSLGGLFPLSRNENGKCVSLRNTAVERVEAMTYAIRRINEDSSILPNVNLTFDIRDTCMIPAEALQRALDYVVSSSGSDDPNNVVIISGVIGAALTDASRLTASIFGLFKIPQISYGSTAAILSDKTRYRYFFRTIPSDTSQVKVIASLIWKFNWTYIFAFYSTDTYGTNGFDALVEQVRMLNRSVCWAFKMGLPARSLENDVVFDMAVNQMSKEWIRNASVAVLFGHHTQANGMLSAVERRLLADPNSPLNTITWIASDAWGIGLDPSFHVTARGMLAIQPESTALPEFAAYFSHLNPNNNNTLLNPWFGGYWESMFNCSLTGGGGGNGCQLKAQTLSTNHTLTSRHPNVIQAVYVFALALNNMLGHYCPNYTLCDEIIVTRSNGQAVNGELLRQYMLNVSLSNSSIDLFENKGHLFDSNGDVQSSYTIFNLQTDSSGAYSFRPVGSWDSVNLLNISVSDIEWRNGRKVPQSACSLPCGPGQEPVTIPDQVLCCWTCRNCLGEFSVSSGDSCRECGEMFVPNSNKSDCVAVPVTYLSWSSIFGIVITVLAVLGVTLTVGTGTVYLIFINHPVIKASSRELVSLLLVGVLLCYSLPLVYLIKPSPGSCAVQRLVSGSCFAIVYSALLVKVNRMHRIFNRSERDSPRCVGAISQVAFALLLTLVQLVVASVWLAAEPPKVKTVLVNRRELELVCDHSPHATLVVTVMYNIILLTASGFFAFLTRKFPESFNESKFVVITVITLGVIWLAFVPTFYVFTTVTARVGTHFQIFSLLITIFLSASTTLFCLLLPKLVLVIMLKNKTGK